MPIITLEPDTEETLNRHDFWRGCYATMLSELRIEHIKEFFSGLLRDPPISGAQSSRPPYLGNPILDPKKASGLKSRIRF